MPDYIRIFLLYGHIMAAIIWFGAALFMAIVLMPRLVKFSWGARREFFAIYTTPLGLYMTIAGFATLLLGFILYWYLDGLEALFDFSSRRSISFLVSLILTIGLLAMGLLINKPQSERVRDIMAKLPEAPKGPPPAAMLAAIKRLQKSTLVMEVLGLVVVLLMVYGTYVT